LWSATVSQLIKETSYNIRVSGISGAGEGPWCDVKNFATGGTPCIPHDLLWSYPSNGSLALEWEVDDLDTTCEVELLSTAHPASWQAAVLEAPPRPIHERLWKAVLVSLNRESIHNIRLRCVSDCGEGQWLRQDIQPPVRTPAPYDLQVSGQQSSSRTIDWRVSDSHGGKIISCEVQVSAWRMWQNAKFEAGCSPQRIGKEWWQATLIGFSPNQTFFFRVRGTSEFGVGEWADHEAKVQSTADA